jgi:hypothetical protein
MTRGEVIAFLDQDDLYHALTEVLRKSLDRRRQRGGRSVASVPRFSDFDISIVKGGKKHTD